MYVVIEPGLFSLGADKREKIHARMGELVYISIIARDSGSENNNVNVKGLVESMRWFLRSIELCNDYLRGYYGVKLVSRKGDAIQGCILQSLRS